MAHEPKLSVYKIQLKPTRQNPYDNYRWLFRNLIQKANTDPMPEASIMEETFKKFISELDRPEMYSDGVSKKCMTANQREDAANTINQNIRLHSEHKIIEGKVEGGTFGRRRNKTSTQNKANKSLVEEVDAITEDFYFLIYTPLNSNKSVLMIQSFSDDTIDSVMKNFWQKFLSFSGAYNQPAIERFIPTSIIEDIKNNSTVSSLTFSTEVPGPTLLDEEVVTQQHDFLVTVDIKPTRSDLTIQEYESVIERIKRAVLKILPLDNIRKQTGALRDKATNRNSPFEIGTDFDIHPTIFLSKYIEIVGDSSDFNRIRDYCFTILEEIKREIYPQNAVQER
jgi:hypothetical protein